MSLPDNIEDVATGSPSSLWTRPIPVPFGFSIRRSLRELHPIERRHLKHSVLVTITLPLLLGIGLPSLAPVLEEILWTALVFAAPAVIVFGLIFHWAVGSERLTSLAFHTLRPLPAGQASDAGLPAMPFATIGLIVLNVATFITVEDQSILATRIEAFSPWLTLTSLFAHADWDHLAGNMFFLWVFGSAVEGRIGVARFLGFYFAAGYGADLLAVLVDGVLLAQEGLSLGASGAVSGVAGLFMVRCYFSRVIVSVPLFYPAALAFPGVPGINVRLPALVVLSLYLLSDLGGAADSLAGVDDGIGHWAHIGGFYSGLAFAYGSGMLQAGLREGLLRRAIRAEPEALDNRGENLDQVLELEPDHVEALLVRARRLSRFDALPQAIPDYTRAIELLVEREKALPQAAQVFAEFYRRYGKIVRPGVQLRMARPLCEIGELEIAARTLERVAESRDATPRERHDALFHQARLLADELHLAEPAIAVYRKLLADFPDSPSAVAVQQRLRRLEGVEKS